MKVRSNKEDKRKRISQKELKREEKKNDTEIRENNDRRHPERKVADNDTWLDAFKPKHPLKGQTIRKGDKNTEGKQLKKVSKEKGEKENEGDQKGEHWVELVVRSSSEEEEPSLSGLKRKARGIKSTTRSLMGSWKLLGRKGNNAKTSTDDLPYDGSDLEKFPTRAGHLQTGIAVQSDHDHTIQARFLTGAVLPKYVIDPIYTRNRKIQTTGLISEVVMEEKPEVVVPEETKATPDQENEAADEEAEQTEMKEVGKQHDSSSPCIPLNIYRFDDELPRRLRDAPIPRREPKGAKARYRIKPRDVDALEMVRRWDGGRTQVIYKREEKSYGIDQFVFPEKSVSPKTTSLSKVAKAIRTTRHLQRRPSLSSATSDKITVEERPRKASIQSVDSVKTEVTGRSRRPKSEKIQKHSTKSEKPPVKQDQKSKKPPSTTTKREKEPSVKKEEEKLPVPSYKERKTAEFGPLRSDKQRPKSEPISKPVRKEIDRQIHPASLPLQQKKPTISQVPLAHPSRATIAESQPKEVVVSPVHGLDISFSQLEGPQRATLVESTPERVDISNADAAQPTQTTKVTHGRFEMPRKAIVVKQSPSSLETPQRATIAESSPKRMALSHTHKMKPTYSQLETPHKASTSKQKTQSPAHTIESESEYVSSTEDVPSLSVVPAAGTRVGAAHGICHRHPCTMCCFPYMPFAYSFKYCSGIPCFYHRHQCCSMCLRHTTSPCHHQKSCLSHCSGPHHCTHQFIGKPET